MPGGARGVQRHWTWTHGHIIPYNLHYLYTSCLRAGGTRTLRIQGDLVGEIKSPELHLFQSYLLPGKLYE